MLVISIFRRPVFLVIAALALAFSMMINAATLARASTPLQSHWLQVSSSSNGPSARYDGSMVYDAATGTTVLFGGFASTPLADTWTWNGVVWTKQAPAVSPPALQGAAMVYDSATHNVVLFGGLSASGPLADTWTWDGSTWTQHLVSGPSARSHAAMVYDAATNNVVLFGGLGASGPLADTWTWNGSMWIASPFASPAPSPRSEQSMVYDAATNNVVLFGGLGASGPLADTWTWNGSTWIQQPAASPSARYGASMFYDATNDQVVLFGGNNGSNTLSDTWEWSGRSWFSLTSVTAPSKRYLSSIAYDTSTNTAILFGGSNSSASLADTWEFMLVPSAPVNVHANSNVNEQSTVTWTAPRSDGGGVIYGYVVVATDVTASSRGGQTCSTLGTTVATVPSSGVVATTCTVTDLTNGDQYRFVVTALNSVGEGASATSNMARPATVPQSTVITQVVMGSGSANVYWSAPASNGGTPVGSYRVVATPGGAFCHVPSRMTSCHIVGLQSGVSYTFTVTATNAAGTSVASAPTSALQAIVLPGAPVITSKSVAGSYITISWQPPAGYGAVGLVGYDVYIGSSPSGAASRPLVPVPSSQLTYTFQGVPGQTNYVIVRAVNQSGIGPFSNQVAAVANRTSSPRPPKKRLTLPSAPHITSITVTRTEVTIRWQPPALNGGIRLAGYDVYIGSSPSGAASRPVVPVPFNQLTYTFQGVPGQTYYVIVRAVNQLGIGPFSNQVAAVANRTSSPRPPKRRPTLPSAPHITSITVTRAVVTIRWQPPALNGGIRLAGYDVYVGYSPSGAASRPVVPVPFNRFSSNFRATPGRVVYVIVRAVNLVGIGPFSNQVAIIAR